MGVWAVEIEAHIAALVTAMDKQSAAMKRSNDLYARLVLEGRRVKVNGSGIVAAGATTLVVDCGTPPVGFLWEVKNFFAGPADFRSTIPGGITTYLFAGTLGDFSPNALLAWTAQFPAQAYFGTHESFVSGNHHLFAFFTGCTAGQNISCGGLALQSPLNTTERTDL